MKDDEREEKQTETKLNLKYIVPDELPSSFSWKWRIAGFLFFILILGGILWGIYMSKNKEIYILHKVSPSDTLRSLALYYYDNPNAWYKIFIANRKKLLGNRKLVAGEKLKIPLSRLQLEKIYSRIQKRIKNKKTLK